jgi:hypothetical protein
MSRQAKWVGVILFLAGMATGTVTGMAVGTPYVLAAVNQHGSSGAVAATPVVSPQELTMAAGRLPVTLIESYF